MADEKRTKARKPQAESVATGQISALTVTSLRESQERLALAMEVGGMFAWEHDLKTGQVVFSERAEQMLGLEPSTFSGTYEDFMALVHADDRAALQQKVKRALQQDAPYELEFRTVRPDGSIRWGLVRGRVYRDAQGRAVRLAGVDVDITARKLAEADALFLAQFSELLRRDGEATTLTREVTKAVGKYLQVQRCFFTEVDLARNQFVIHHDHCEGVPTIANTYTLSNFNPALVALTSRGEALTVCDARNDPRAAEFDAYAQLGIRALVGVPLLREGRMVASLVIATASARDWQPREISLLETIAELTWQVLERLRSEAVVCERDARLQSILNDINEIVWSGSPDAAELYFLSPSAEKVYGRPIADFYANPKLWEEAIHPDDRGVVALAFQALAEHGHYEVEYRIVRPDGEIRWLVDRGYHVCDEKGEVLRLDGVAADITARKESQAALRTNEARFAGIINSAMDAIISVDQQQHIILFNHAAEEMFGYTAVEMMGQSLKQLLPASARDKHAGHIQRFGETKTTTRTMGALGAISGVRKGGEEFPIEASISQVEANGQKLFTVILRDITRRKEAEERLLEQASLLSHAREAIIVVDIPGNILFWNSGAERLYGWAAEEVLGRIVVSEIFRANQEQRDAARRILIEKGEWSGEFRQYAKDGRELVIESHLTLVRDAAGEPKSILIINNDITEKKQLETQFLRAQRLESIGTLASGIAHDLNNVLSPLLMAVQLLQFRLSDENSQRLLDILQQNVQRGSEMIKQVLAFARGTSGERLALQPRHLIKEVITILKETFPKDITIKYSLPGDLTSVSGDPTQLHQVLMNLCVNARDAMAAHGGTLTITAEDKVVDAQMAGMLPHAQAGHYLIITIADTGTGIAPDVLEKIFDPFFTTKEIGRGTGLGLSTVHSIIKSHGGFVNVYSEIGRGTSFHLYLPVLEATQPVPVTVSAEALTRGNGEWILVVDDEEAIRAVTQSTLEAYGYHVLTATDGAEAIGLYVQHKDQIQIVVTDMMMPYLDGPATIRALRNINPAVEIIASSGLSESEKAHEAEALGVQAFLTKPYSAADLLHTLAAAFNRHTDNFTATWREQV